MTNKGKHRSTETPSRWKRRILGIPVIGWLIGIAGTALAVAGFVIILGTTGTVTTADALDVIYAPAPSPAYDGTSTGVGAPNCDIDYTSDTASDITISDVTPGSICELVVRVWNVGDADAMLNGFVLASGDFSGGEVTATVETCGQTVLPDPAMTGSAAFVTFSIHFGTINPGTTYTFDPLLDGLDWRVPSSYDVGECTQTA